MSETYFLKDTDDNRVVVIFEVTEKCAGYVEGVCRTVSSWGCCGDDLIVYETEYLADVSCKFDGCTHWYFKGEDYDPDIQQDVDSYYHLCGEYGFINHIRAICFVWKVCEQLLSEMCMDTYQYDCKKFYFNNRITVDLVDSMLNGYAIEKG